MNLKSQNSLSQLSNNENETSLKYTGSTEFIAVPSFLLKTYEIVSDPGYSDIVSWNKAGDAFVITKTNEFCEKILPVYFKHKNLSSFVRQLNMYGFHKTKYKNNEQCFTHKFFRRDNKKLLLEMKRKTKEKVKEKSSDKKNSTTDSISKINTESKVSSEIKSKFREQDKRILQLVKTNKEFKNSVLALYTELEKLKEREQNLEKMLMTVMFMVQKGGAIQIHNDERKDKQADWSLQFDNKNVMNLLKGVYDSLNQNSQSNCSNFSKFGQGNLINISGNNMSFLKQYNNGDDKHSIINGMIENGHMNDNDQYNGLFDSIPEKVKKRDLKAIQVESNNNQWSKTGDIKSILENSPPKLRRNSKSWDKNSFFDSQDHSVDIEYDHIKLEKPLDTISLVNHNILGDTINKEIDTIHPLPIIPDNENNNFEILSKNQEEDLPLDSISSFSSEQKLCGIKRTHEFEYQK